MKRAFTYFGLGAAFAFGVVLLCGATGQPSNTQVGRFQLSGSSEKNFCVIDTTTGEVKQVHGIYYANHQFGIPFPKMNNHPVRER